jgi:uncharacterized protein
MRDVICDKLTKLEKENGIYILLAVESGSRVGGFDSVDSDYDVRFVFARPTEHYLNLSPIQYEISLVDKENILDIVGWDISKTLNLMLNSNHQIREWLRSPIVYRSHLNFIPEMKELALKVRSSTRLKYSCSSFLHQIYKKFDLLEKNPVNIKKYFYALRCALTLKWLDTFPDQDYPPMNLQGLTTDMQLTSELTDEIAQLLLIKREAMESTLCDRLPNIDKLIVHYFHKKCPVDDSLGEQRESVKEEYTNYFRKMALIANIFMK